MLNNTRLQDKCRTSVRWRVPYSNTWTIHRPIRDAPEYAKAGRPSDHPALHGETASRPFRDRHTIMHTPSHPLLQPADEQNNHLSKQAEQREEANPRNRGGGTVRVTVAVISGIAGEQVDEPREHPQAGGATMATNAAILNHCGPCCTTLRPMTHTARIAVSMSHGVEPKRNL